MKVRELIEQLLQEDMNADVALVQSHPLYGVEATLREQNRKHGTIWEPGKVLGKDNTLSGTPRVVVSLKPMDDRNWL